MKSHSSIASLLVLLFSALPVFSDLNSDREALLDFAASIFHTTKLNWNAEAPVCSSWIGITCNLNKSRVIAIHLPGSELAGSIPANSIGKLDALRVLSLRSNLLNGNLPSDVLSIPSLQFLYLQHNNFSGAFPTSLSHKLVVLDLSFNAISGNIPTTIQNLTRLTALNLQNNSISGAIPNLNLPRLKLLNFSYNKLNGSIPSSLQKYPNSSFVGNPQLCGPPLNHCSVASPSPTPSPSPISLPSSPTLPQNHNASHHRKKLGPNFFIVMVVGGAAVLFFVAMVFFLCCFKKTKTEDSGMMKGKASTGGKNEKPPDFGSGVQEAEKNKLFFFQGCSYSFDLEDLLRASAEILGKGSNGTTYKAVLEEGTTVVVKRLKEVMAGKKEFEQQMEVVGRLGQHPNVVPLRAYYYSKDEKLLVYNYMPAGSLFLRLHGSTVLYLNPTKIEYRKK